MSPVTHTPFTDNKKIALCLLSLFVPESMLDVGCGDGGMVAIARRMLSAERVCGVDITPLHDVHLGARDVYRYHDLIQPLNIGQKFDLVTCIEVAEHLPERAAPTLCRTLGVHCRQWLVFSAAAPGQGGEGHITLKPGYWWRDILYRYGGMTYDELMTVRLKLMLQALGIPQMWIPANVQVFGVNKSQQKAAGIA